MGLDQYMYIAKKELDERVYEYLGELVECDDGTQYYNEFTELEEIAYFRKSNWLHGYLDRLCENVTGSGIENCTYFVFTKTELQYLLDDCREVVAANSIAIAKDLLPPMSGFFFGSTAIDDYYFEDVQDFINTMEDWEDSDELFVYYAWW